MRRDLVLFDIDGTLIRAGTEVHRASFAHAYRTVYGVDCSLDGVPAGGRTDTWLLAEPLRRQGWFDEAIGERRAEAFAVMCDYVDEHLSDLRHCVLPGVAECLNALSARDDITLGLLTGNVERIARAKLRACGLDRYFETGGFGEESEVRADLVRVALRKADNIPAAQCLIVGDTPLDVEAGRAHGTITCAVATGIVAFDDLLACGAHLVLQSLEGAAGELLAVLRAAPTGR
jgi:phosphoglycolate phosphatase-like HAD superfamily hydrolase